MDERAERYLKQLQTGAKRRRRNLTYSKSAAGAGLKFKWHGVGKGIGRIDYDPATKRIFILERSGDAGDSVVAESNRIFDSFRAHTGLVPWSILEFEVRLPDDMALEKFKFLTGRVTLNFKAKRTELIAERWGLADMVLAKHSLADWACALLDADVVSDDGARLHLARKARVPMGRSLEAPTREDIRRAVPFKHPAVTEAPNEESLLLKVPLGERSGFLGWVARKTNAPNESEIELDAIGAYVWSLIDGKRTVTGIAEALSNNYKLTKHEAEASLLEFIERLRRRGCVSLRRK